jgi:hypothetical protein
LKEGDRVEKVKVTQEVADALDKLKKDDWNVQFNLINHCKMFSGNGVKMGGYLEELKALEKLSPLEFARCLIIGYEVY